MIQFLVKLLNFMPWRIGFPRRDVYGNHNYAKD